MHSCRFALYSIHFRPISNNRLRPPSDLKLVTDAFAGLTELQLNGTLMTWQAILDVIALMPRLNRLESGYNRLQALTPPPPRHTVPAVTTINLDCNQLSRWAETFQALSPFRRYSHHLDYVTSVDGLPGSFASSSPRICSRRYPFPPTLKFTQN